MPAAENEQNAGGKDLCLMITPVDVENKEFKKGFHGYRAEEVDDFLAELIKDYSKLYRENAGMKDKNAILNETVENYKSMEETMRSAIVSAQRTSEEIIRNANEQADNIVNEAKIRAKELINDAEKQVEEKRRQCAEMEAQANMFRAKLKAVLHSHLEMMGEMPEPASETKRMEPIK